MHFLLRRSYAFHGVPRRADIWVRLSLFNNLNVSLWLFFVPFTFLVMQKPCLGCCSYDQSLFPEAKEGMVVRVKRSLANFYFIPHNILGTLRRRGEEQLIRSE